MTTKELLYVEDALGHEQYFQTQCCEIANQIQDSELRDFALQLAQTHKNIFGNFYNLLWGGQYHGWQKLNGKYAQSRKRRMWPFHARNNRIIKCRCSSNIFRFPQYCPLYARADLQQNGSKRLVFNRTGWQFQD